MTTITEYYAKDHDRLDALFKGFQELKKTDPKKARENFVQFKFGLQRHIIWEEDILFPIFDKATGQGGSGPTAVMRLEHREILKHLERIHDEVAKGTFASDTAEAQLFEVLTQHNLKEEKILYSAIDAILSEEDYPSIFRRMEEVPPERYETCC